MHPYLIGEMARLRHEELMHEAEEVRRARSARPRATAGRGMRHNIKAAIGNRLVATGWRLLEAGLPNAQALTPATRPSPDEAPC